MGMLYNAYREGTPLVVTAGQQDRRFVLEEPILWGQMVEARPAVDQMGLRSPARRGRAGGDPPRACKTAMTPPTGPVFLSIPWTCRWSRPSWT